MLMTWLDFDFSRWASETSKFIYGKREHLNVNYSKRKKRQRGEHINNSFHYLAGSGKSTGEGRAERLVRALLALHSASSAACWGSGLPPAWWPRALDSVLPQVLSRWPAWWLRQSRICLRWRRPGFTPWVGKVPLEKRMATQSSIIAWWIPWTEKPGGCSLWSHKKSDTTEWLNNSSTWLEKFSKKP